VVPGLGLLVAAAWWWGLRDAVSDDGRRWRARLGAVIAVDALLLAGLFSTALVDPEGLAATGASARPQPRIGVQLDPRFAGPGVRVSEVVAGSPAARAGVRVRDVILSVDGEAVASAKELAASIAGGEPGVERVLQLTRDGQTLALVVAASRESLATPLWAPQEGTRCAPAAAPMVWLALALLSVVAWLFAWRSGLLLASVLAALCSLLIAGAVESAASWALCERLGGLARGHTLFALTTFELTLCAGGLAFWLVLRRAGLTTPTLGRTALAPAVGLGLLYCFAVHLRWGIGFVTVSTWLDWMPAANAVQMLPTAVTNPTERLWLTALVALVGPISEELVFRGVLLPGLCVRISSQRALLLSSALFALMHIDGQGVHAVAIFGIGWVLGWIRLNSADLRACMLVHIAFNAIGLLALGA
jgi:membrane protease YdiL (CAAX protease family)